VNAHIAQVPDLLTWNSQMPSDSASRSTSARGIRIDATGHIAAPPPMHEALVYSEEEAEKLISNLESGIGDVGLVSDSAGALLHEVLSVILLRNSGDPGSLSSSSWPSRPGVIGIVNSRRPGMNRFWIMDSLVHESIHSLLYGIEKSESFYLATHAPRGFKARSPWTGRDLFLHSYLHACFVWFGLWSFWRRARLRRCFVELEFGFFEKRAHKGFAPHLLSALGEGEALIRSDVRKAVSALEVMACESSAAVQIQ